MGITYDFRQVETIAAISTAPSEAGIGIIRISGPEADRVIGQVFRRKNSHSSCDIGSWRANTIHYGFIIDPDTGELLDEVLVSWMKAPHSYTAENTAEINTHGGMIVLRRVLNAVFRAGARPADPGEFTKRAFLNGRIDLSEAEAVMELIQAQSEFGRRTALAQLSGSVSDKIRQLRERILYETAFIECALDDPDNYSLEGYPDKLYGVCVKLSEELNGILHRSEEGEMLNHGIPTAIIGRPNVGKSSLSNLLTGNDRAIVTDIPGTTRDILESNVCLNFPSGSFTLRLMDTAGIRSSSDPIEKIGVERALQALQDAQLILFVMDGSQPLQEEDHYIADRIHDLSLHGVRYIILVNKSDLPQQVTEGMIREMIQGDAPVVHFSCRDESGMDDLRLYIEEMFHFGDFSDSNDIVITGERRKSELRNAIQSLDLVCSSILNNASEDLYSIDLMNAYTALGRIIGEEVEDDLVDKIFSEFCMGK